MKNPILFLVTIIFAALCIVFLLDSITMPITAKVSKCLCIFFGSGAIIGFITLIIIEKKQKQKL